ncbi:MAG: hypothetical protein LBD21_11210 [Tannerellaceae bacterium]|jgi:hypothetical protein|nr:hypothetical protein [Tannerellaceae bacterium]
MNKTESLLILVKSLTKAEKRYFRLWANLQAGDKAYLALFELLDRLDAPQLVTERFEREQEGKSFEMAGKYLYRVLMDCLIRLREKQDVQTEIGNRIAKAAILFERDLPEHALDELAKAKRQAAEHDQDLLLHLVHRTELRYLSAMDFDRMSERELVSRQMRVNEIMKHTRSINQHLQLYDILRHRLIYKGYARSEKQKEDLNDLVLSELHLIANSSYKGFEAEKLHLLFQATYYLNSGSCGLAIRYYRELINLFERNRHLMLNPPIYYLFAVRGILDSLMAARIYREMSFFLSRLEEMEGGEYSAEFVLSVQAMRFYYLSLQLIHSGSFEAAGELLKSLGGRLLAKLPLLGLEDRLKLHLAVAIYHISAGEYALSRRSMRHIFGSGKLYHAFPSFKIARLLNLILQAELGNYDFFENEIEAIKRDIGYEKQIYATEKLIFRFVRNYPLPVYEKNRLKLWESYRKDIRRIEKSKYERLLQKTFNFAAWIESKLTRRPLRDVLLEAAMG